jgi:D-alanine-D-alanine ligase
MTNPPKATFHGQLWVIAGGVSEEREVSLRSGQACHEALLRRGYPSKFLDLKTFSDLSSIKEGDTAFLTTHGDGGEDGRLQGLLDWMGVHYTGSGFKASALCMDKIQCKSILKLANLPVCPALIAHPELSLIEAQEKLNNKELFGKTRAGGSSIGARPIITEEDWADLLQEKDPYMIEPRLKGREITISGLETENSWKILPILELQSENEFYDYEAKYTKGMTHFLLPAPLEEKLEHHCKTLAQKALTACSVSGAARVDMMLTTEGPRILEVNTLPGMTETSDLPAQASEEGLSFDELVEFILSTNRRWSPA